ncbi:phosphatidylserine decarboxylase [Ornithinibacillus caprae]|uniref:phosphatidylserine decarboxylase n=1 Tax=Ornithinibacillus caprae TaxID=2678566 RepID=UPI0018C4B88B|nr:phosphatidylserine decarboxylase [Ornithinibacillus caprae]
MKKTLLKSFVELTGNPISSSILKTFTRSRISKPLIGPFSKAYEINTKEMEYPISHYKTLHSFFTRGLQDDARPIDQTPNYLISPVDGMVSDHGIVASDYSFYIKNHLYSIKDIFGDNKKADQYKDGYFFILYLSPSNYHRIHYPVDGALLSRYALGEKSYPVNRLGMKYGNRPLSSNYRLISELSTEFGKVAIVKVGALNINSIQIHHSSPTCKKGEELGYFSFGSTVILFLEKHRSFAPMVKTESSVRVGQPIGEWP